MRFDGFYAQAQLFGDLTRPSSLADQPENFQLAVAQAVHDRPARSGFAGGQSLREFGTQSFAEMDAAVEHLGGWRSSTPMSGRLLFHDVGTRIAPA